MRLPAFKKLNENLALFLGNSNFHKRLFTGIILGSVTIYVMLTNNYLSTLLVSLIYLGCIIEWLKIVLVSDKPIGLKFVWLFAGVTFISTGAFFLLKLCNHNARCLLLLCSIIWTSDIGAYVIGNLIKGPKLIPRISPNKTWSGAIGGLLLATCIGIFIINYFPNQSLLITPYKNHFANTAFTMIIVVVGQLGDLIESYAKRCFNIRDSSQIIPGHGGILDRCDSIIAVGFGLGLLTAF